MRGKKDDAILTPYSHVMGGVEPTSFAKIVPLLDIKFKIGDFISDLKVISFFFYSFLLFPFFL